MENESILIFFDFIFWKKEDIKFKILFFLINFEKKLDIKSNITNLYNLLSCCNKLKWKKNYLLPVQMDFWDLL